MASMATIQWHSGGLAHGLDRKAVLLDRDNTINLDPGYLNNPDDVALMPGAVEGLQRLQEAGFLLLVLSNQSGVGRGKIRPEELLSVNHRIIALLLEHGIRLERIYFCPHIDGDQCACRKPASGLVVKALEDFALRAEDCWIIGDRFRDLACAVSSNIPGILVGESEGSIGQLSDPPANLRFHVHNLQQAADSILGSGSTP
ncbi:MAG: HAD family hydrolase [Leptospiraceae bacterium]|nr:HAD family hydrolase [Leptospiraceae bacterium]